MGKSVHVRWAKRGNDGWFVNARPGKHFKEPVFTTNLIDHLLGDVDEASIMLMVEPKSINVKMLRHEPLESTSYRYVLDGTDIAVQFDHLLFNSLGSVPAILYISSWVVDRSKRCPIDSSMSYLDWYDGHYDSVYIALHPFWRSQADVVGCFDRRRAFSHGDTIVPWSSFAQEADLPDLSAVNRSLRYLREKFEIPEYKAKATAAWNTNPLHYPDEDFIGSILLYKLVDIFRRHQIEYFDVVYSSFEENPKFAAADLLSKSVSDVNGTPNFSRITALDRSFTIEVEYDHHYSVIAGRSETLRHFELDQMCEGFWADSTLSDDWWMTPAERAYIAGLLAEEGYEERCL